MTSTIETIEARARRLVEQEVILCMSSMVSTLAGEYRWQDGSREINTLIDEATELYSPLQDFEEAATQAGWSKRDDGLFINNEETEDASGWEDLCREYDIKPHDREIFEHWVVTGWLAATLKRHGEKVGDLGDLTIWCRTTTGQAIYADHVFEVIAKELLA